MSDCKDSVCFSTPSESYTVCPYCQVPICQHFILHAISSQTPLKIRRFNRYLNLQGVQRRCEPWQLRVWQWHFPDGRTDALYWKVSSIFVSEESRTLQHTHFSSTPDCNNTNTEVYWYCWYEHLSEKLNMIERCGLYVI